MSQDKVKRNIKRMIDQGASEKEIDAYIASEGMDAKSFKQGPPSEAQEAVKTMTRFAPGGPLALAIGAMQALDKPIMSRFNKAAYDVGGGVTDIAAKAGASPEVAGGLGYATNVGIQAIPVVVGGRIGQDVGGPVMKAGGRSLMRSAVKPGLKSVQTGKAKQGIETLLKRGYNPTEGGALKMEAVLDDIESKLDDVLKGSTGKVNKGRVGLGLLDLAEDAKRQANPQEDLAAIKKAWVNFRDHPLLKGSQDIPVPLANQIKRGTYTKLADKYGELGNADVEAQKTIARMIREQINKVAPASAKLNQQESDLLAAITLAKRRAATTGGGNPIPGLAVLAHDPKSFAAMWANSSTMFKSLLARMLYSGSERIPQAVGSAGTLAVEQSLPQREQ